MKANAQNDDQAISELKKCAECVDAFYDALTEIKTPARDNLPMSFFRALAALTKQNAEVGVKIQDIRFTPVDLANKVLELGYAKKKPKDKEDQSDWVRKNWAKLEEFLEQRNSHLQTISRELGNNFYPAIEKEKSDGGGGKYTYYYLSPQPLDKQEVIETLEYPCPDDGVKYVQESLINIPRWARWINGFSFQSWRKYILLVPGCFIFLFLLLNISLVLMTGLYTEISTVKWLTSLIISLGLFFATLSSALYRVILVRIVMAPLWMIPLKETNVQLELRKTGVDSETGNDIRELRLLVYSAKCPICFNRIELENGGLQFPFRIVGRCIESPREHVYSFDHVTKVGRLLLG